MTREMEMARKLYEMTLDIDYMDYADTIESELEELASEIKQLRDSKSALGYVLECISDSQADSTPCVDEMERGL